jgi:hypothetical protein
VRKSLEDALYATYASLFRQKDLPATESGMGRGIECSDGWYAILDGLCDAMSVHGRQAGHPSIEIAQVKQKMAGLRIYTDGRCDWCSGAIDFACRLSGHVCEETGRRGTLMVKGRMLRTFAEDVGGAQGYRRYQPETGVSVVDGPQPPECLPPGWRTIASVLRSAVALDMPDASLRFGYADGELMVDCQSLAEGVSGAIACARMMAVRSNLATGTMRIPPLDDIGGGNHTYRR